MFSVILLFFLCFFISLLSLDFFWMDYFGYNLVSLNPEICFLAYVLICLMYLMHFRKENLFCFEIFFFIIFGIVTFYSDLILPYLMKISPVIGIYSSKYRGVVHDMAFCLQLLSICFFMIGGILQKNILKNCSTNKYFFSGKEFLLKKMSFVTVFILAIYWVYIFASGKISSWFHYSNIVEDYSNSEIVYLTILFLVITVLEFNRLALLKVASFKIFIKEINKVYMGLIFITSLLLLISGNRNESVLIFLPFFVSYNLYIKKIKYRYLVLGIIIGWLALYFVGLSRQDGIENVSMDSYEYSLLGSTKDYAAAAICTDYLVQYTNINGPRYFASFVMTLFSSVPFLGGLASYFVDVDTGTRSTILTTNGMQLASNMNSGLGTSLVGDVYYTGALAFVFVFFLFFGYFMSFCHSELVEKRSGNLILTIAYLFMFGNVIYFPRAEWAMPFRYIGFSIFLFVLAYFVCLQKKGEL